MIPRTFPSVLEGNTRKMVVYILPSVVGLQAWKDYIPVKGISVTNTAVENTYANDGYQVVKTLGSTTGTQAWVDYIPVYEDATLTKPWSTDIGGYIPASGLSSLNLDFTLGRLDPRITFSRTSNATLTGSNGLVQYAPHNLLTYSEQFDNAAWLVARATISANTAVAPDGTTTADTLVEDTTNNSHPVYRTVAGFTTTAYTLSCYIKANVRTQARIAFAGTAFPASPYVNFDLSAVTASGGNGATGTITAVGNGWYLCAATATAGAAGNADVYIQPLLANLTNYLGTGANALYIWGAQLNIGSLQSYNPTTVKNLLGYTEHFDNAAWTKSNASISATKVDDIYGKPFAQKLVESTANDAHALSNNVSVTNGTLYTFSCYAKRAERKYLRLVGATNFAGSVNFDLDDGSFTVTAGTPTVSVTPVGNGWFRCSITAITTATTITPNISMALNSTGTGAYTGDGTSGIYIFGAQLSDSASLDPYVYNPVAAPAAAAYYGPRFDYDPVTLAPKGLLIEEQRTNLLTYSDQFDNAAWNPAGAVTANTTVAPDGNTTADTCAIVSGGGVAQTIASGITAGATYTISVWVKASATGGASNVRITTNNTSAWSTGITQSFALTSSWQRITLTGAIISSGTAVKVLIGAVALNGGGDATCVGNIDIWGAQLEAGSFATSYIPTVASQVTRAADNASMIGNNFARWYTQGVGTAYSEFDFVATPLGTGNKGVYALYLNASNNIISYAGNSTGKLADVVADGGVAQAAFTSVAVLAANTVYKDAQAFSPNDFARSLSGATVQTDALGTVPLGLTTLRLGWDDTGTPTLNGHLKRIAYFPRRLSNSELQSITA